MDNEKSQTPNLGEFFNLESKESKGPSKGKIVAIVAAAASLAIGSTVAHYYLEGREQPHPTEHEIIYVGKPFPIKEIKIGDKKIPGDCSLLVDPKRNVTITIGDKNKSSFDVPDDPTTIKEIVGREAYVLPNPEKGYLEFEGKEASNVSKIIEIDPASVTAVKVVLEKDKEKASSLAEITFKNGTVKLVDLNESKTNAILDYFDNLQGGDNSIEKWSSNMVGQIGPSIPAYKAALNLAQDLNVPENLFGKPLEYIIGQDQKAVVKLQLDFENMKEQIGNWTAENYTAGQKLILDKYAFTVAKITGQNVTDIIKNETPINATAKLEQILFDYIGNAIKDNRTAAGNEAEQKVLTVWREDLWNNYSAWLQAMNVTQEMLNKTNAQGLWEYTQRVINVLKKQGEIDTNADGIVIKYGTDGNALNDVLNKLSNAGRFNLNFTYNATNAKALQNLTEYLKKKNMSLPYNITEIFEENRYPIRILDTRGNGSIAVVYDLNGKLLPSKTKILSSELTKAIKEWAKDYGLGGSGKDD